MRRLNAVKRAASKSCEIHRQHIITQLTTFPLTQSRWETLGHSELQREADRGDAATPAGADSHHTHWASQSHDVQTSCSGLWDSIPL